MTEQTPQWRAVLTYRQPADLTDEQIADVVTELPGFGIAKADGQKLRLDYDVDASTIRLAADEALRSARRAFTTVAGRVIEPVSLRVLTLEEYDQEMIRPEATELVGFTEIAQMLGVSAARAGQLADLADFPQPVARPAMGPVFTKDSVEAFGKRWQRKPGRPRKHVA